MCLGSHQMKDNLRVSDRIFTLSIGENEGKTKQAIYWIGILVLFAQFVLAASFIVYKLEKEAIIACVGSLPILMGLWANHKGRTNLAASIFATSLLLLVTIFATIGQGIHDIGIMAYPAVLIAASLVMRRRSLLYITGLSVLCIGWLVFGEMLGLYHPAGFSGSNGFDFIVTTSVLVVTTLAIRILGTTFQKDLADAEQELQYRTKAQDELSHSIAQVQERTEQLTMLAEIGRAVTTLQDLNSVLDVILEQVQRTIPLDVFFVCLYNEATNEVTFPIFYENGRRWQEPVTPLEKYSNVAHAIRTGESVHLHRTKEQVLEAQKSGYHMGDKTKTAASALFVPLQIGRRVIGAIAVQSYELNAYTNEHLALLIGVAPQAAIAIENARLFEETNERAQRLATLNKIGHIISTLRELPDLFETVYQTASQSLHTDLFFIGLYEADKNQLTFPLMYDEGRKWEQPPVSVTDETFSGRTIISRAPLLINQWRGPDRQNPITSQIVGDTTKVTNSLMFSPLVSGERIIGVISVQSYKENAYNSDDLALLTGIANQVAIAVENARLYSEVQQELTDRQHAEKELQKERDFAVQVMNTLGQGVTVTGPEGHLEYVNPAFAKILGCEPEELIGKEIRSFTHPEDVETLLQARELRKAGKTSTYENRILNKNGEIVHVLITGSPRRIGKEVIGSISVITDLTGIKQIEIEREALIKELEAKNAELEQFTYTVSHDLKSPLITIRGYLGYLEKDTQDGDQERLRKDMERITQATNKMQILLNELLELSRIGRVINQLEDMPLQAVIDEAMSLVEGAIRERKVRVEVRGNFPRIYGDRARLIEVVQNLLENAVNYMGGQPEPKITIGLRKENNADVFFVKDNGIGIDPQFHERIFGLFNKLNPESTGTGVGLALVKRIVEVHGGKIWVESELGKGATFYFTLGKPQEIKGSS